MDCISSESEEEESSSADECGSLAVHLSRVNLLNPVRMDLPTIEDVSPDTSSRADYSNNSSFSAALQPPPSVVLDYVDDYEVRLIIFWISLISQNLSRALFQKTFLLC